MGRKKALPGGLNPSQQLQVNRLCAAGKRIPRRLRRKEASSARNSACAPIYKAPLPAPISFDALCRLSHDQQLSYYRTHRPSIYSNIKDFVEAAGEAHGLGPGRDFPAAVIDPALNKAWDDNYTCDDIQIEDRPWPVKAIPRFVRRSYKGGSRVRSFLCLSPSLLAWLC